MIKIILFFLGRGIKAGYALDSFIKETMTKLGENFIVKVGIQNKKIFLCFWLENGKVICKHSKKGEKINADLTVLFKNEAMAKKVLFGKKSIEKSFCEHGFLVYGDIAKAMMVVPILEKVEVYLFTKGMNKKLFYEVPKKEVSSFRFYIKVLFGI